MTAAINPAPPGRIEWPDMLRGASALAIVLFHARVAMWVGARALAADDTYAWIDRATAWVTLPFPFFGTAVMLFFVVSGFAIHFPYAGRRTDFAWRPYAVRRLFRIYPPYAVAVLVTVLAERIVAGAAQALPSSPARIAATGAMAQNYVAPAGQMAGNPSLWSLPVEVELYLIYPLLLWIWRRIGTTAMASGAALVSVAATVVRLTGHDWPTGNFAAYLIIWVSGAILAEWLRTDVLPEWRSWHWCVGGVGCVLALTIRAAGWPTALEPLIWGGLYFLVVLWGLNQSRVVTVLPARLRGTLLFLGRISYSLYLIHFPLLLVAGALWTATAGHKPISVAWPLLASLVPLPFAWLLWRYVERPSQALGRAMSA